MVSENEVTDDWRFAGLTVRRNLNNPLTPVAEVAKLLGKGDRGQAYIDEDKIIPIWELS